MPLLKIHNATPIDAAYSTQKISRRYHRECSKHKMKESRYRHSGSTQSVGVTTTSSHSRFVVASNIAEPQAASAIHRSRVDHVVVATDADRAISPDVLLSPLRRQISAYTGT